MTREIVLLMLVALLATSTSACKKAPAEDPSAVAAAEGLPGAAEVMNAVAKKDFEGVLAALAKVQEQVTTEEQTVQFRLLAYKVREKITEIAPTDPKAMEVVATLRGMSVGR